MHLFTFVVCVFLLTTTSGIALPHEVKTSSSSSNDSQSASVQEVSQPSMTVENASPQDYILQPYYTFNKGEPFYVEKDPLTGAIDFNKKTTPTSGEKIESNTSSGLLDEKGSSSDNESDYFYDDQDFVEDGIDRKDGSIEGPNVYRPNDIFQNPYKISPDLHQFLNLPVHYSSSDKFPLISSSYANTKVQGTGSSSSIYSNHKYVTSSTQSPSYYTMPTTRYSTSKPYYLSTSVKTTTNSPTTKLTSTTTEAEEDYDNTDYGEYEVEDSGLPLNNQAVPSEHHTYKPDTTRYTVTTYRPSTFRFTTTTTTKPSTVSAQPTTEKPKQPVSIVTSLPLDVYYSSSQESTSSITTSTSPPTTTFSTVFTNSLNNTLKEAAVTSPSTESHKYNQNPSYNVPNEEFYPGFGEEPFRPIFGPSDNPLKHEGNNQIQYNKNDFQKQKPNDLNEFHRLPPHQNIPYVQRPTLPPQMNPPRPDASQLFFSEQQIRPGQQSSISFGDSSKLNTITRPIQDTVYERPPPPPSFEKESKPIDYKPQNSVSPSNKPDSSPIYESRPSERPEPNFKPRPVTEIPVKSNFKLPSKVESHFIKVSPNQENPSYSLQTSFSIGVPASPAQGDKAQFEVRPGQGVGQVLFPDNTPAENTPPEANINTNLPSQVLRPPNNRLPIQSYQPNRPGYRQPIHMQVRPPSPPFRVPNDDLRPPSEESDSYPRPHWENPSKPFYGPTQNAIPKKELILPQNYPGLNRGKPENIQQSDLPNILPQFRPNAKVGHVEYPQHFSNTGERLREPFDTLQPPPLPQPQHLRINRNDDEIEIDREVTSGDVKVDPFVHRRSGPQIPRVTTLQMMQQKPQIKTAMRPEFPPENRQSSEKDKPVFLVYPSAHGMTHKSPPEEVVVIGTRAQQPLPPANLEKDNLDSFPLDDNKQFPIPGRDRVDTPILKTKLPTKPLVRNEFPYPIVKPYDNNLPEERILATGLNTKEYTEFSPTPASSTEENKEHDSGINIIPYLQDYMPFATKKPQTLLKPTNNNKKDKIPQKPLNSQVISTILNASLATTTSKTQIEKIIDKKTESQEKSGSEMTVSATMYTQQRPANHKIPVTYTPSEPQPLGFQAPFMASLSAPESQGWTVVTDKNLKPVGEVQEETKDIDNENKFDIENFKPQLFGGFKPILPSSNEDSGSSVVDKEKDLLINKGDREERAL